MILDFYYKRAKKAAKQVEVIGQSVMGRDILAFSKGNNSSIKVLIHGAIHAREYITGRLVTELLEEYKEEAEVWFVPFVNPDGVLLVTEGADDLPYSRRKTVIKYNHDSEDFSQWKANINGVDLNVNFDALWGSGALNIKYPNYENYIGPYPFSEPETRALRDFTIQKDFIMSISYHTKGQIIYWGFDDNYSYKKQAKVISRATGYPLRKSLNSAGGYKDWFTMHTKRLGLTIEAGNDKYSHPLEEEAYNEIYKNNKDVAKLSSNLAKQIADNM